MSDPQASNGGLGEAPPESASPSVLAYRGSIAALVLGSFVALFLVLRPPEDASRAAPVRPEATNTPAVAATATATPEGAQPSPSPTALPTTEASPTAVPATPTPGAIEYAIIAGDTLSAVAESFGTTVDDILAINPGLDPNALNIGALILVPRP